MMRTNPVTMAGSGGAGRRCDAVDDRGPLDMRRVDRAARLKVRRECWWARRWAAAAFIGAFLLWMALIDQTFDSRDSTREAMLYPSLLILPIGWSVRFRMIEDRVRRAVREILVSGEL